MAGSRTSIKHSSISEEEDNTISYLDTSISHRQKIKKQHL
jgi:hypothetical protein